MNKDNYSLDFQNLPFVYELQMEPKNDFDIPNTLPFKLDIDLTYDLVKQKFNNEVEESLRKAYKKSSILGGNVTEDNAGEAYAKAVLDFIKENYPKDLNGLSVLDIGCGTGYLLYKLKGLGCNVKGIEPGSQSKLGIERYKIPIINDFYPPKGFNEKFDLIICNLVIEHVNEPEVFLNAIKNNLKDDGTVIIGVPDEEPYIKAGDISMLFHEHYNYFTKTSFKNFLELNGATNLLIRNSTFGGIIFSIFNINRKVVKSIGKVEDKYSLEFKAKLLSSSKQLLGFFEKNKNKEIGIFVPGRIVNFLYVNNVNFENLKFYDDDPNIYNRYFPGINIPIKNFNDFKIKQPNIVLVMSSFFGQHIRDKIIKETNYPIESVFIWTDFYK